MTFNNYKHNNDQQLWQHKNIISVVLLSLLLILKLIWQAALVNFMLFLNILKAS